MVFLILTLVFREVVLYTIMSSFKIFMNTPLLSIVIPTREGFEDHWLQELLKVEGNVEVILVHPPSLVPIPINDPRFKQINSTFRGEVIQRMTGLLNATGIYVLTINCDEYIAPKIALWTSTYFARFPDSWVMRLRRKGFNYGDKEKLGEPWAEVPDIQNMKVFSKSIKVEETYNDCQDLMELPIVPLTKKLDWLALFRDRTDQRGLHIENFDKKVWKTSMVNSTLQDISNSMIVFGPVKYVPFWCLDRLLGLSLQAKFFEANKIVGHLLPWAEQLRIENNPPEYQARNRFYLTAEILLLKQFPQYNYIWTLTLDHIRLLPKEIVKTILNNLTSKKS